MPIKPLHAFAAVTVVVFLLCALSFVFGTLSLVQAATDGQQGPPGVEGPVGADGPAGTEGHTLTQQEINQLANINAVTINNTQWSNVRTMQDVAATDDVLFSQLFINNHNTTFDHYHGSWDHNNLTTAIPGPALPTPLKGQFTDITTSNRWAASVVGQVGRLTYTGPNRLYHVAYNVSLDINSGGPTPPAFWHLRTYLYLNGSPVSPVHNTHNFQNVINWVHDHASEALVLVQNTDYLELYVEELQDPGPNVLVCNPIGTNTGMINLVPVY